MSSEGRSPRPRPRPKHQGPTPPQTRLLRAISDDPGVALVHWQHDDDTPIFSLADGLYALRWKHATLICVVNAGWAEPGERRAPLECVKQWYTAEADVVLTATGREAIT